MAKGFNPDIPGGKDTWHIGFHVLIGDYIACSIHFYLAGKEAAKGIKADEGENTESTVIFMGMVFPKFAALHVFKND